MSAEKIGCGIGKLSSREDRRWLKGGEPSPAAVHFAFVAKSRAIVDAFYSAAMAAGAKDNISPRIRHEYHANYYAADVLDPDGYSVEVVIKTPETGEPE